MNSTLRSAWFLSVFLLLGAAMPAYADETGMGQPENTNQSSSMTLSADAECGLIKSLLGLCQLPETLNLDDAEE